MANPNEKVQQLPLDRVLDADIIEWIESLPRARRNETLRAILRSYITGTNGSNTVPIAQTKKLNEQGSRREPSMRLLTLGRRGE